MKKMFLMSVIALGAVSPSFALSLPPLTPCAAETYYMNAYDEDLRNFELASAQGNVAEATYYSEKAQSDLNTAKEFQKECANQHGGVNFPQTY